VTGGKGEERKVAEILVATKGKAVPLVGKLSVKELAALFRRADLFVSNSTGPLHLAAAVGTPVVGLYPQATAMSQQRWGPYARNKRVFTPAMPITCEKCARRTGDPCLCMASISVEEVFAAACGLLESARKQPTKANA